MMNKSQMSKTSRWKTLVLSCELMIQNEAVETQPFREAVKASGYYYSFGFLLPLLPPLLSFHLIVSIFCILKKLPQKETLKNTIDFELDFQKQIERKRGG